MAWSAEARLGPHEILEPVGAGDTRDARPEAPP